MFEYRVYWTTKCGEKFVNYLEAEDDDIGIGRAVQVLLSRIDGKECEDCVRVIKWGRGGKGIEKTTGVFCPTIGLPEKI